MRGKGEKNNCQRSKFRVTKLVGRGGEVNIVNKVY